MTKQTENDNNNKAAIFCRSSTNSTDDTGNTDDSPTTNNGGSSMRLLRIAVGTINPCKIDAVTKAIKQSIESTTGSIDSVDIDLQGFSVDSSVPDQPFGDVRAVLWAMVFYCCCCCLFLLLSLYCACACACTKSHRVPLSSLLFFYMYISVAIGTNNKWC